MKKILLIEDEPKTAAQIKEILSGYEVELASSPEGAAEIIAQNKPSLIILDHDLKGVDGLQVLRQSHLLAPFVKTIVISASNDIPLAVAATKMGAAEFLKKPVNNRELAEAVQRVLAAIRPLAARPAATWLAGQSPALTKMYEGIQAALPNLKNIILFGEKGIDLKELAQFIHDSGPKRNRKLKILDLADWRRENLEGAFWAAVQEAIGESKGLLLPEEDRCGTLFLDNLESLDDNFRLSILEYFRQRREKTDPAVLTVVAAREISILGQAAAGDYTVIEIPPLRQRREDLPWLIGWSIMVIAAKYNKQIKNLSAELLLLLSLYDFPGNYQELTNLVEAAVLKATGGSLELKDVPLNFSAIKAIALRQSEAGGQRDLAATKRRFERLLYKTVLAKLDNEAGASARFFDLPKTVLVERLAELGQNLLD